MDEVEQKQQLRLLWDGNEASFQDARCCTDVAVTIHSVGPVRCGLLDHRISLPFAHTTRAMTAVESYSVSNKVANAIPNGILASAESLCNGIMNELTSLSQDIDTQASTEEPPIEEKKSGGETPERTKRFRQQKQTLAALKQENEIAKRALVGGMCCTGDAEAPQESSLGARVWNNWPRETSEELGSPFAPSLSVDKGDVIEEEEPEQLSSPVTPLYLKFHTERKERAAALKQMHRRSMSM